MIPFASQRGGGQDLATHLMNSYDNEVTVLAHLRGAIAADLHGAFKEWQMQAQDLTRCEKYLYSLSINPDPRQGPLSRDQYMDYIGRTEEMLGLAHQPRAIVFHEKYGREHCHVVWSRIDAMNERAVHLAFDHEKLMRVTRAFARDHGLRLPPGYEKSNGEGRGKGQESLYDREKARQTGLTQEDHVRAVTQAWQRSDSGPAFVQALSAKGYLLATGKRPYVLVDIYGGVHALARLIDDKAVKTADLRAFLGKDFPPESLPRVEEAIALVARHRDAVDKDSSEHERATALSTLKRAQQARKDILMRERAALDARHSGAVAALDVQHTEARRLLTAQYLARQRAVAEQRAESRPTGLAAFLGRITGVDAVRRFMHRRQDAQQRKAFDNALRAVTLVQTRARLDQLETQRAETTEQARREKALLRVERREIVALLRDLRTDHRVRMRGSSEGRMPSLEGVLREGHRATAGARPRGSGVARESFGDAATRAPAEPPNVLAAFARAAQQRREAEAAGDRAPVIERKSWLTRDRQPIGAQAERGPEGGRDRD